MTSAHPYRWHAARPRIARKRRWSELDAELVIAALSAALVVAALCGQCAETGMTLGLLGLLGSLSAIVGWLRRPPHEAT